MKHQKQLLTVLLMSAASMLQAQRSETLLEKNWKFSKGDFPEAAQTDYNDTKWESVVIPHDWDVPEVFHMSEPDGIAPVSMFPPTRKSLSCSTEQ